MSNGNVKYHNMVSRCGRFIGGNIDRGRTKDADGKPLTYANGDPRESFSVGLAVPKSDIGVKNQIEEIVRLAGKDRGENLTFLQEGFSWKIYDGDSTETNDNGKRYCDLPHYAGNYVFWFTKDKKPECYTNGGATLIHDNRDVKKGFWIRVAFSMRLNTSTRNPGIYLNLDMVDLVKEDEEIISRPDAKTVFGGGDTPSQPANQPEKPDTNIAPPPPPSASPDRSLVPPAAEEKYVYEGVTYTKDFLVKHNWTEDQISRLEKA